MVFIITKQIKMKNNKTHFHGFERVFYDILRDNNSLKYSMTKFASLVGLLALLATVVISIIIMIQKQEIDHVLIVEIIGFVLTLLGFKNSFGYKGTKDSQPTTTGDNQIDMEPQKQLLTEDSNVNSEVKNC